MQNSIMRLSLFFGRVIRLPRSATMRRGRRGIKNRPWMPRMTSASTGVRENRADSAIRIHAPAATANTQKRVLRLKLPAVSSFLRRKEKISAASIGAQRNTGSTEEPVPTI